MEKPPSMSSVYRALAGYSAKRPVLQRANTGETPRRNRRNRRNDTVPPTPSVPPAPPVPPAPSVPSAPSVPQKQPFRRIQQESPPRMRILHSQTFPVLTELSAVVVEEKEAVAFTVAKEPVVEFFGKFQQKTYFVDYATEKEPFSVRNYGLNILLDPPFHTVTKTLTNAHRLGTDESLASRGGNREVLIDFKVDKNVDLSDDVVIIIRFARAPIYISPAPARRPNNLQISLNQKTVIELKVISHKVPAKLTFGAPVELPMDSVLPDNQLFISWTVNTKVDPHEDYLLNIECAKRKSLDTVMAEVSAKRFSLPLGVARAFRQFSGGEEGLETKLSTVSLICPLSRKRIETAVRGTECGHLACFDALNYLALNTTQTAKWTCPRCNESVPLEDLVVDDFVVDILQFTSQNSVDLLPGTDSVVVKEIAKTSQKSVTLSDSNNSLLTVVLD